MMIVMLPVGMVDVIKLFDIQILVIEVNTPMSVGIGP